MNFQGNYIDLLVLAVLFFWVYDARDRGIFLLAIDLLAFVGSFLLGLFFYGQAAQLFTHYFTLSRAFANALGFVLIYILSHAVIEIFFMNILRRLQMKKVPPFWQKLLGLVPATANGLIVVSALLTLAISLPLTGRIKQAIFKSEIGGYLVRRTSMLDRTLDEIFGDAIQESMAFLTVPEKSKASFDLGLRVEDLELSQAPEIEKEMFYLINKERKKAGVGDLESDMQITIAARNHAHDMFTRSYFSHLSPEGEDVADRLEKLGVSFVVAGENLAFAPSLELAHDGLMQSESHRANILAGEFIRVGIGVVDGKTQGKIFVQIFAD